jgi:hypothetical protein
MAEHCRDDLGMDSLGQQQRRGGVAHIMQADAWYASPVEQGAERAPGEVPSIHWRADHGREHEIPVVPDRAELEPGFELADAMTPERLDGPRSQRKTAPRSRRRKATATVTTAMPDDADRLSSGSPRRR